MADRTIYRLTEENDDGKPVKIVYSQFKEELEEERDNSEVETQYIEEIEFNADDMNDLCKELNSHHLDKEWEDQMDAFILFVLPPLLGYGIYLLMKNDGKLEDFVQCIIGYAKRIGKKKDE